MLTSTELEAYQYHSQSRMLNSLIDRIKEMTPVPTMFTQVANSTIDQKYIRDRSLRIIQRIRKLSPEQAIYEMTKLNPMLEQLQQLQASTLELYKPLSQMLESS